MSVEHRDRLRRIGALALFGMACAVAPSLRETIGGQPVSEPAAMSLLSFCLACVALALVIRSAIGERGGRVRTGRGRHVDARPHKPGRVHGARVRVPRQDLGRD